MKYDIFISYRREGGFETANLISPDDKFLTKPAFVEAQKVQPILHPT